MASGYGFLTQQERETEKRDAAEAVALVREKRRQVSDAVVERIGPIIRESLAEYFTSMGQSVIDHAGQKQPASFKEVSGIRGHTWGASSQIKTGTHSDYQPDGVHVLDEVTAYKITVSLAVDQDSQPLLYVGDYVRSKLVGNVPVAASDFPMAIPSSLAQALENKTGIKVVDRVKFLKAHDN